MFFEVKTKRLSVTEQGAYATVKEVYVFEAENYTDAESSCHAYMAQVAPHDDFEIVKISATKYETIRYKMLRDGETNVGNKWWKVKVLDHFVNDKGKVKKIPHLHLIEDKSTEDVSKIFTKELMAEWGYDEAAELVKVEATKVCQVFVVDKAEFEN